ncbi:MAG: exodeoxyribonuclease VII large subunit [Armatimonadia bacterium]|nr:exodeoxyribonuclease VII large subunit [Armatimonadia bacterium]
MSAVANASPPGDISLTVSQLTAYVKRLIDQDEVLQQISVRGEISNYTAHRSGHLYFSLKDEGSQLSCVCFRGDACRLGFDPEHGQQVIAHGNITVYEPRGQYQLIVRAMRPDGAGELAAAIAKLRAKLEAEGLFERSRKLPLPRFPRRIALVTSPTGAAVRDLVSVISRRFPPAEIVVVPTLVQGEGAPESIVESIKLASGVCRADLVIVGRGGGSLEDLWAFYNEEVVRAVFACPVPVISAVGHETDVSLTDEVADLRAPTPSAAGELAVPDIRDIEATLDRLGERARASLREALTIGGSRLGAVCSRPIIERPLSIVEPRWQRLDEAAVRVMRAMDVAAERLHERLTRTDVTLRARDPRLRRRLLTLDERGGRIRDADRRARSALARNIERVGSRMQSASASLRALDPTKVIERGYALVWRDSDQRLVRSVGQVAPDEGIHVSVADGEIEAQVIGTSTESAQDA